MSKRLITATALVAAGVLGASVANASIIFSNLSVTGVLGPANTAMGSNDIDFTFDYPAGTVGDPVDPLRAGSVTISYDADSNAGSINEMIISALGAALGSGHVNITTTVEDRTNPGVIGVFVLDFDEANPPPVFGDFAFSRGTASFRVTNVITATAPNTDFFDFAQISLLEERFVPAPGSIAIAGLAGLVVGRRRRV